MADIKAVKRDVHLTPHFSLHELTHSDTAVARGIDNTPTAAVLANLQRLASVLERVRAVLGVPIHISSGYRSPDLNRAVGGVANSVHMFGLAADITAPAFGTPLQVAQAIQAAGIEFDQLIHEYGRWVHIGLRDGEQRGQLLTYDNASKSPRVGLLPVRS